MAINKIITQFGLFEEAQLDTEKYYPSTLDQAGCDWWRNKDRLYLNGKTLSEIVDEKFKNNKALNKRLLKKMEAGKDRDSAIHIIFAERNYQLLVNIWIEEFGRDFIKILSQHAHQGSITNAMQSALCEIAANNDYVIAGSDVAAVTYFKTDPLKKQLEVIETVNVRTIRDMSLGTVAMSNPELEAKKGQREPFSAPILEAVSKTIITENNFSVASFDVNLRPENIILPQPVAKLPRQHNGLTQTAAAASNTQIAQLQSVFDKPNIFEKFVELLGAIFSKIGKLFTSPSDEFSTADIEEKRAAFHSRKC